MRRINAMADSDAAIHVGTADRPEVVYDVYYEVPVIELRNTVWVEAPKYLAFTGTEPAREIDELIEALTTLRRELAKAKVRT